MKNFLIVLCLLLSGAAFAASAPAAMPTIMVFGDSISSGYGLPPESGWVSLLQQRLQTSSPISPAASAYRVINASISGETALGGRKRIKRALGTHRPDIVIVELGGNDGLRGASIESIRDNLGAIIQICQQHNAAVLLTSMRLPPNYGIAYTQKFQNIYPQLAKQYRLGPVPFMFEGFGDRPESFQADGIHPTLQMQEKMLDNVWRALKVMLKSGQKLAR